jgi:post-segregation antitoxin (ccd killing protein)
MTKRINVTIPDNLFQYMKDKGLSPSKVIQIKLTEEIIAEGKEKKYNIQVNDN